MAPRTARYKRGVELMEEIHGPGAADGIQGIFRDICPDFGRFVVETGFADVYGREGLSYQQRQLLNVALLTALGGSDPLLAAHMKGALHVGVKPREIVEAIFHVAIYAGHPRTVAGFGVAKQVFEELGIDPLASDEDGEPKA
jgi:4-carboxymuconolactone decarboxylase